MIFMLSLCLLISSKELLTFPAMFVCKKIARRLMPWGKIRRTFIRLMTVAVFVSSANNNRAIPCTQTHIETPVLHTVSPLNLSLFYLAYLLLSFFCHSMTSS